VSAFSSSGRRQLARALVVCCAALAIFAAPAAATPPPRWKKLLNEWYAGHIDHTYPIPCYHQAIAHLPRDVQNYSSAKDDILRALQQAISHNTTPTTTTGETGSTPTTTTATTTTTTTTTPKKHKSPFGNAIKKLTPGGADAFPLPLLILGMLALLLVLAGLGGMAWRRYQGRRGTA
jgi:hypothetical protein